MRFYACAALAAVACAGPSQGVTYDPTRTQVVLLGTGTPNPDPASSERVTALRQVREQLREILTLLERNDRTRI